MKRGCGYFGLIALILLASGCIIIPHPVVPEEDEFAEQHLASVEAGKTHRTEIEKAFGPPQLARQNGQLVIYAQARTVAGVIVGGMYWGDMGPIESYSSLIIQFDETGIVTRYDVIRGSDECTDNGLCIEAEFAHSDRDGSFYSGYVTALSNAILFTSADEDEVAKDFRADPVHCTGYLYNTGPEAIVKVYTASGGTTWLHNRGYVRAVALPGEIELHAASGDMSSTKKLECIAGDLLFVNLELGKPPSIWSSKTTSTLDIRLDEPQIGKAIVSTRMLIIE
jgi:hypothetical protein